MNIQNLKQETAGYRDAAVKAVSVQYIICTIIISQAIVLWLSAKGPLFPGEERFLSIVGTCAEIIAGLYGITMAGYTFFLSRMDALTATDTTLDYVVASVKTRFKYLVWYITITFAVTLFTSIILMYYPASSALISDFFYRLVCNEFILFLSFTAALILYYSVNVIDPKCLEKEAVRLQKKLSPRLGPQGSAAEFIALYDQIEQRCNAMVPEAVLHQLHENKGKRFSHTIELLYELKPKLRPMLPDLTRVHRYYECMVNSPSMAASQEICVLARRILSFLEGGPVEENFLKFYHK